MLCIFFSVWFNFVLSLFCLRSVKIVLVERVRHSVVFVVLLTFMTGFRASQYFFMHVYCFYKMWQSLFLFQHYLLIQCVTERYIGRVWISTFQSKHVKRFYLFTSVLDYLFHRKYSVFTIHRFHTTYGTLPINSFTLCNLLSNRSVIDGKAETLIEYNFKWQNF